MCNFLSALVKKNGDVLCNPVLNHHSELISYYGLRDTSRLDLGREFVRVEFVPPSPSAVRDFKKYKFRLDENRNPSWWNETLEDKVKSKLRTILKNMVLDDGKDHYKIGGCWIVDNKTKLRLKYGNAYVFSGKINVEYCETVYGFGSSLIHADHAYAVYLYNKANGNISYTANVYFEDQTSGNAINSTLFINTKKPIYCSHGTSYLGTKASVKAEFSEIVLSGHNCKITKDDFTKIVDRGYRYKIVEPKYV